MWCGSGPFDMDVLGIEIRADSLAVAHFKSSFFSLKPKGYAVFGGDTIEDRLRGLKSHISVNAIKDPRVAIVLSRGSSVYGVIDVPAPNLSAIKGILRFELEKHIPFGIEDAYWGFDVIAKKKKVFSVLFAAVKRNTVDKIVEEFRGAGLEPENVGFWQASVGNALFRRKNYSRGGRVALAGLNPGTVTLDVFSDFVPVYSRSIGSVSVRDDDGAGALKAGLTAFLRFKDRSTSEKKIEECVLITEKPPEGGALKEWERDLGLPVVPLRLNGIEAPFSAAAVGTAISATGKGRVNLDLLPSSVVNSGSGLLLTLALSTVVVILLLLTGATYIIKDRVMLGGLDSAIAEAKARKTKIEGLVDSGNASSGRIRALERIRGVNTPGALDIMRELAVTLQKDTWLTDFEYDEGVVFIEGFSDRASSQLLKLERSGIMKDVEFAGPVTKSPGGKEHFRIKLKVTDYNGMKEDGKAAK